MHGRELRYRDWHVIGSDLPHAVRFGDLLLPVEYELKANEVSTRQLTQVGLEHIAPFNVRSSKQRGVYDVVAKITKFHFVSSSTSLLQALRHNRHKLLRGYEVLVYVLPEIIPARIYIFREVNQKISIPDFLSFSRIIRQEAGDSSSERRRTQRCQDNRVTREANYRRLLLESRLKLRIELLPAMTLAMGAW
ncbi:hypothetical protein ACIG5C_07745 [Streptomyces werraensis]|uniref:hypothetical protein n=1 Tax=Streptomyces werraensis TaxID=68284 RepID=UPI0037D3CD5B